MKHSKVPAQSDREPVDYLANGDKAVILGLGDLRKKLIAPIPMQREGYSGARWTCPGTAAAHLFPHVDPHQRAPLLRQHVGGFAGQLRHRLPEVEFVTAVTAGGSVKFLPAV